METYNVERAQEFYLPNGEPGWQLALVRATDRHKGSYLLPDAAFEWRAAEYGIDPEDKDTLLDVILHEPFSIYGRGKVEDDPAYTRLGIAATQKRNKGLARIGDPAPVSLMNAASREEARTAMLARIEHTKQNRVRVVIDPPVLSTGKGVQLNSEKIKSGMRISREAVAMKSRYVGLRRRAAYRGLTNAEAQELSELSFRMQPQTQLTPERRGLHG